MAVGRISGPLLKANLVRQGVDLAFETDLLYLDVSDANAANHKVGIKNQNPYYTLDVTGTVNSTNSKAVVADFSDVHISTNTITTNIGDLILQAFSTFDRVRIGKAVIPEIYGDVLVTGNLHATGNITADGGTITLGDGDTDNVVFNADINSNILPNTTDFFDLGTSGKRWNNAFVKTATINTLNLTSSNITTLTVTGNGTIGGTFGVTGATTLSSTLAVTSNATVGGTLGVTGATTLSSTLSATGAVTLSNATESTSTTTGALKVAGGVGIVKNLNVGGNIGLTGNLLINTDKFVITATTGNTAIAGTLDTVGTFKVNTDKFVVTATNGNTAIAGTLDVTGNTELLANLVIDGNTQLGSDPSITGVPTTVTVYSSFVNSLTPNVTNTYNLGSTSKYWQNLYVKTQADLANLRISGSTLSATTANTSITLTPTGTGYALVSGTAAFGVPAGNTDARPGVGLAQNGMIRYNTELSQYEGYGGTGWSSLGGIRDTINSTYIIPETSPGAGDKTLHFYADYTEIGTWNTTALTVKSPGFRVPVGTNADRPTGVSGYIRYNTDQQTFEGYQNTTWASLGGVKSVDGLTYITAESAPGASDDTLSFYADGTLQTTITPTQTNIKGQLNAQSTANAVSTSSGSIITAGGVGIAKNLYVGINANIAGNIVASGSATFNPVDATVSIQPTGAGTVTIYPGTVGYMDNMRLGDNFPRRAKVTDLNADTSVTFNTTGTVTINPTITGTINNISIGTTTRSTGAFTTLTSNGVLTVTDSTQSSSNSSGAIVTSGGIGIAKNLNVGGNSTFTGTATAQSTFTANSTVSLDPLNYSVSIQPTGTGTVTINPTTTGSINNMNIGATTAGTGKFTDLTITGSINSSGGSGITFSPTGTGTVTINPNTLGAIDNMAIGATTPSTGKFTQITDTALTSGRIVFSTTGGQLTDDIDLTYDSAGNTLSGGSVTLTSTLQAATVKATGLTAGRVAFVTTGGQFTDASALTYNSGTFTLSSTNVSAIDVNSTNLTASSLTSGRITYATTGGKLTDDSSLYVNSGTLNSTALTTGAISATTIGSSSNATIGGTLGVTGATTLSTVSSSGLATLESAGVTNNATVGGTLGVTGNLSINTNKFIVSALTGNTTVAGTLNIAGKVAITDSTQSSDSSTGSIVTAGGMGIGGNLYVGGNIVTGSATVSSTFTATSAVSLSPTDYNVTISPQGTGTVTINPNTTGNINNMIIGATTPKSATFTSITDTGNLTVNGADATISLQPTGSGTVTIGPGLTGTINNMNIGATSSGTGKFTTLEATTSATFNTSGTVTINPSTTSSVDNVIIGANTAKSATFTNLTANTSASLSPSGTVTINPSTTSNMDNVIVGANNAKAGTFTNLTANTSASLSPTGTVTINPGTLGSVNNVNSGASTRGTGAFTTLTANGATTFTATTESTSTISGAVIIDGGVGIAKNLYVGGNIVTGSATVSSTLTATSAVNLSPANFNVTISPTGTGTVTIGPETTGAIDNIIIGANVPRAATFTTLTTQNNVTLNGSGSIVNLTPTGSGYVTINPGAAGTINNMSVGQTTPLNGKFTNLVATTSATLDTSGNISIQPTGTVTINPASVSAVDNVNIGANTRGTGAFTTLSANGAVTITDSTQSTTTTSGALQVSGGVGIVKNLYVGGNTSIAGNLTVLGTTTTVKSTVTTLSDPVIAVGGDIDTGLVDPANRGMQTRYARDISSNVTSWVTDGSSSVTANLTVTAASLGFKLSDKINIGGSGLTGLDGIGVVTAVGSNTVTFDVVGTPATATTANVATVGLSKNGFFGYEPTSNKFVYIPDATISSNVVTGDYGDAKFNSITLVNALGVEQGGTGRTTFTSKGILYGNAISGLNVTAQSDMGATNATTSYGILTTDSSNTPVWTDTIDCGTY